MKKITYKEWQYIGQYNHAAKWLRPLCSYSLRQERDGGIVRNQKIGWLVYLIIFIPAHLAQLLWCLWDGGLKEFEFASRNLGSDYLSEDSESWKKAKEIWERV